MHRGPVELACWTFVLALKFKGKAEHLSLMDLSIHAIFCSEV